MSDSTFHGIMPALLTPFTADGEVNYPELRRLVRWHLDSGVHGFFACGSAGEGILMPVEERAHVLEAILSEVSRQVPVMAHVGAMSTKDAAELARLAKKAGAQAIATLPPMYFPLPWEATIGHVRAVAEAGGLPTYYYHIPYITRVEMTADEAARMREHVPNFAGFKYSHKDLYLLWAIRDAMRDLTLLFGSDEQIYQGLLTGAQGGIGSTYNYMPGYFVALYDAVSAGDHARAQGLQHKINQVIRLLFKYGANRATEKTMVSLLGFEMGPPRMPTPPFREDLIPALKKDLEEIDFFDQPR